MKKLLVILLVKCLYKR